MIPLSTTESVRKIGQALYFEYHCLESSLSHDAELWYHSHQRVTVIGFEANDGWDIVKLVDREETGHLIAYSVRFSDGFVGCAIEDELLDSEEEYYRPDPPRSDKSRTAKVAVVPMSKLPFWQCEKPT